MNDQIRKLAEQSGLRIESWMTNPPKPFQILGSTEDFEKFAQLIVRECVKVMYDNAIERKVPPDINQTPTHYAIAVLEHFGVEE